LKPGVAAAGVKPELDGIVRDLTVTFGGSNPPREVVSEPILTHVFGQAAYALNRLLASLLFGVGPTDPTLYTVAAVVVLTFCILASYWPARRAMLIDPLVALRQ
jgi:hypothetical protein